MRIWNWVFRQAKRLALLLAVALLTFLGMRIYTIEISGLDNLVAAKQRLFAEVREEVARKLPPDERVSINRYFEGSKVSPPHFAQD
jgi:hypothetical protein